MRLSFLRSLFLGFGWALFVLVVRVGSSLWVAERDHVARGGTDADFYFVFPHIPLWLLLGPLVLLLSMWALHRVRGPIAADATKPGAR